MGKHAKISPSAANRWLNCTASPNMEEGLPDTSSDAADKGTCYHAVAEIMLSRLTTPALAAGNVAKIEVRRAFAFAYETIRSLGTDSVPAERAASLMNWDEAEDQAKSYVVWVLKNFGKAIAKGAPFGIEARATVSPDLWGTVDFWCQPKKTLYIVDLKTGRFPVSPENNPQLLTYASGLAFAGEYLLDFDAVELVVFQGGSAYVWGTHSATLVSWGHVLRSTLERVHSGGEVQAGEWCKFCKAKPTCEGFAEHALQSAKSEFGVMATQAEVNNIQNMTGETLHGMLNTYATIEAFIKAALPIVAERMYREGLEVPGYKVVRGTKHKAFDDKDATLKKLGPRATKTSLMTPNQCIKALGDEACAGLWSIPRGELKVVTEKTRGKPVTASAAIEFAED